MDRPYLSGVPGNTRNISGGLQDYSQPVGGVEKGMDELEIVSDFYNQRFKNEDRWVNQSIYYPKYAKMTHFDIEWPKELEARPVTRY